MKIIVGLGNVGGIYDNTYHNLGFSVVDMFAKQHNLKFSKTKCQASLAIGDGFVLAKPNTFMNNSGDSVKELKKYFKTPLCDILIVVDDIDLPCGKIRFKLSGSGGTHNGLRDIVEKVGETPKLKIGTSKDPNIPLRDFVLSKIDDRNSLILNESKKSACKLIDKFIAGELCQNLTI